jgi:hypothetical protein
VPGSGFSLLLVLPDSNSVPNAYRDPRITRTSLAISAVPAVGESGPADCIEASASPHFSQTIGTSGIGDEARGERWLCGTEPAIRRGRKTGSSRLRADFREFGAKFDAAHLSACRPREMRQGDSLRGSAQDLPASWRARTRTAPAGLSRPIALRPRAGIFTSGTTARDDGGDGASRAMDARQKPAAP